MRLTIFLGAIAALSFPPMAVHAHSAPAQPPAVRWSVDGSSGRCAISRPVQGPFAATMVIRAWPTIGNFELMLVGKDVPKGLKTEGQKLQIDFEPEGGSHSGSVGLIDLDPAAGRALAADYLPPALLNDFGASQSMRLTLGKTSIGTFTYGSAARVVSAFHRCAAAKLTEWGADPAAFEPGGRHAKPIGDVSKWLPRDLAGSNRIGKGGAVAISRMTIGADGAVEACEVVETNHDKLGAAVCKSLIARARFEPARGPDGRGVRSLMLHSYDSRWQNTFDAPVYGDGPDIVY